MRDTPPEVEARYVAMLMAKSPEERFRMGCSMFDTAKAIVKRAILDENPSINEAGMRQQLFLRFYGLDFGGAQKERILRALGEELQQQPKVESSKPLD